MSPFLQSGRFEWRIFPGFRVRFRPEAAVKVSPATRAGLRGCGTEKDSLFHCRRHLPKIEAMVVIMMIHYPFELPKEQVRTANGYAMVFRIHTRELSIPERCYRYQYPDEVSQNNAILPNLAPVETQTALHRTLL